MRLRRLLLLVLLVILVIALDDQATCWADREHSKSLNSMMVNHILKLIVAVFRQNVVEICYNAHLV